MGFYPPLDVSLDTWASNETTDADVESSSGPLLPCQLLPGTPCRSEQRFGRRRLHVLQSTGDFPLNLQPKPISLPTVRLVKALAVFRDDHLAGRRRSGGPPTREAIFNDSARSACRHHCPTFSVRRSAWLARSRVCVSPGADSRPKIIRPALDCRTLVTTTSISLPLWRAACSQTTMVPSSR